jgi:hypothetical protein
MNLNNNENIQPVNFKTVPGEKIIGFDSVGLPLFEPLCEPITGVPIWSEFGYALTTIKIKNIDIVTIINMLEDVLGKINKITWEKGDYFEYTVEYNPISDLKIDINSHEHKNHFWGGLYTVNEALKKFPHNIPDYDDDDDYIPPTIFSDGSSPSFDDWCKFKIQIYYYKKKEKYILEFNCRNGESKSFFNIHRKIKNVFENETL